MLIKTGWLKYLWNRRGIRILHQSIRMAKFHKTPFKAILENIFEVMDEYQAGFTFPIVASVALRNAELMSMIRKSRHEVASHGFKHVNYRYISKRDQELDILRSIWAFKSIKITIRGFRAPYNAYTDYTPKLLEKHNFLWDIGIGYASKYRGLKKFFRIKIDGKESNFLCIPLSQWSDDAMIDRYGLKSFQMVKILKKVIEKTAEKHGVVMFDLHPIRIGQPKYIDVLREILAYGERLDGWFPTVTEAVNYWLSHKKWKGDASFCCLLTGDIDNFTFEDYLLRLF